MPLDSGVVVVTEERQWTVELLLHKVNHICIYSRAAAGGVCRLFTGARC